MEVSVEPTGALERRMTVSVPEERVEKEVEQRLKRLSRTAKLDGFRPGKVPLSVARRRFGPSVRQEVMGEVMQSSFYEAVSQQELRPAGTPSLEPQQDEEGKGFSFTATFEVYPEVELAPMDGLEFEKPSVEITDADIDRTLDVIRGQQKTWEEKDGPAGEGDRVTIDFKGTIDGEAFEGGEANDFAIELGQGRMIEGFEEGLTGKKAGEETTLKVTFPEEYHAENLAGKQAEFATTVKKVEAPALPEVDDEFAQRLGVEGGAQALREEVRGNMERELEQRVKEQLKQQVMDKLIEINQIDLPSALVEQESGMLANQMRQNLAQQGANAADIKLDPEMFRDQAERRVALGLILSEIVQQNELKVEEDELRKAVEDIAAPYERPEDVVNWYYGDRQRLAEMESLVLEGKVVDWVLEKGKVTDKPTSFEDVMNPEQAGQA